ncbi:MAG: peptidoglycan editing factor PgeF [Bryobacteraceae bacterium]
MSFLVSDGGYRSSLLAGCAGIEHHFGVAGHAPAGAWLELRQIHSARVIDASEWRPGVEGDALATGAAGIRLAVKTADCIPLLLADERGRAVAAVHAGWRGVVQGIGAAAVRFLSERYLIQPGELVAALGPAIGGCCYEVGPEVAVQFRDWFPERNDLERRTRIDLREALRRQLLAAGVKAGRMDVAEECTCCGGNRFHSYRRDGAQAGRMYSVISLREGG